jgi:hypothetical protein
VSEILAWIGGATLGGVGLVAVAYWIFQTWGTQWLQSRFNTQLEAVRHAQAQEMENLRFRIGRMMDRSIKLHEREFEMVPEAWRLLVDAYYTTTAHTSSARMAPAVQRMNDEQLEEFLAGTEWHESQKQQMRDAPRVERSQLEYKFSYLHEHPRVEEIARTFNRYLEKYGIFISNKSAFKEIGDIIWDALGEYANMRELEIPRDRGAQERLNKEGRAKLQELEADIHRRFWKTDLVSEKQASDLQA